MRIDAVLVKKYKGSRAAVPFVEIRKTENPLLRRGVPAAGKPGPAGLAGRRLTRDSWVVSFDIPRFPTHFFAKNSGKLVKIGFLDSRDQNKILKFS